MAQGYDALPAELRKEPKTFEEFQEFRPIKCASRSILLKMFENIEVVVSAIIL